MFLYSILNVATAFLWYMYITTKYSLAYSLTHAHLQWLNNNTSDKLSINSTMLDLSH